MIRTIKRWAFWPLLAVACMTACSMLMDPDNGSALGTMLGLGLSLPLAVVIDYRRRRI